MAHYVKCYYCGKRFDRDTEPFITVDGVSRRYAHANCQVKPDVRARQALEAYIQSIFGLSYTTPLIQRQIDEFVNNMGFTYSGIQSTLLYYFDILGNRPKQYDPSLSMVPTVYPKAKEYYRRLWEARQVNQNKKPEDYKINETVIKIIPPQREPMKKRKLFTFLDEEE